MDEKFNTVLVKKPFHTGSGELALLTIAAAQQGKFWEANDAMYTAIRSGITAFNIQKFAAKLQLDVDQLKKNMYSPASLKKIESDIRTGLKNNIVGTPLLLLTARCMEAVSPMNSSISSTKSNHCTILSPKNAGFLSLSGYYLEAYLSVLPCWLAHLPSVGMP